MCRCEEKRGCGGGKVWRCTRVHMTSPNLAWSLYGLSRDLRSDSNIWCIPSKDSRFKKMDFTSSSFNILELTIGFL